MAKKKDIEQPTPNTGITSKDVKRAIDLARKDSERHPALKLLTKNIPPEYDEKD